MTVERTAPKTAAKRKKHVDLLIIGSGAAGSSAAFAAKEADPSLKVMIVSRELYPVYSAPALPDYLSGELGLGKIMVRSLKEYRKAGIQLKLGQTVSGIDTGAQTVLTDDGSVIVYRDLILATGSFPIRLRKMQGTGLPGNYVMKTVADVDAMIAQGAKRAVVVGSGAIGLEGSLALKARGLKEVTMVEALDWLSPRSLDRATSDELCRTMESFGVRVITGEAVEGVEGKRRVRGVITSGRTIPCDMVLWGIGMRPDTSLAEASGIKLGELGGIFVDDHMRTNVPHVYACGDCVESTDKLTGRPAMHLFWEPAQRGGIVAGRNAAGGDSIFTGSLGIYLTHKGGISITALGKTENELDPVSGTILEDRKQGTGIPRAVYRRLLFEDGYLCGVQLLNTLDDIDLFFDTIQKNALRRDGRLRLQKPLDGVEQMSVTDAVRALRRERRAVTVSGPESLRI